MRPHYLLRALDALSQLGNVVLLNGEANESISGRAYREGWHSVVRAIDTLFFWDDEHCRASYFADLARAYEVIEGHNAR